MSSAPCLCGCAMHTGECPACKCPRAAPDYLAAAEASGELEKLPEAARAVRRRVLREWTRDVAQQLQYRGPPRRGLHRGAGWNVVCAYCGARFATARVHTQTCSGACRQGLSKAKRYESVADIPPAACRRETFSQERQRATGHGLMTAAECYAADVRVVTRATRPDQTDQVAATEFETMTP